jgi:hypothetical protein
LRKKIKKLPVCCEICGEKDKASLHEHHIVERTEINSTNHDYNLAIICASCHCKVHSGSIKIIGIYPSTKPPLGRTLIFEKLGDNSLDMPEPPYKAQPLYMRIHEKV